MKRKDKKKKISNTLKKVFEKTKANIEQLPDHIKEYFAKTEGSKEALHSGILFNASEKDIDLKTDINWQEIVLINKLKANDRFLIDCGLNPIYKEVLNSYMRLKVSMDRKSRTEFVDVNRGDNAEKVLDIASNIKNISDAKK